MQGAGRAAAPGRRRGARHPVARGAVEPRRRRQERGRAAHRARHARRAATRSCGPKGSPRCANRLAQGSAVTSESDVLDALAKAGFVTLEGVGDGDVSAATFPGPASRALVLGGPDSSITGAHDGGRADPGAGRERHRHRGRARSIRTIPPRTAAPWITPIRNDDDAEGHGLDDRRRRPGAGPGGERARASPISSAASSARTAPAPARTATRSARTPARHRMTHPDARPGRRPD